jgi:HPt (histidine-containing phosphotransfer) domain-containing protein
MSACGDEQAALDTEVIVSLLELSDDDGPGILAELVEMYLTDTPPKLDALHEALTRGDSDAVAQLAHTVKGSSGSLGAKRMAVLCAELEEQGRRRNLSEAAGILSQVSREYQTACRALEAAVRSPIVERSSIGTISELAPPASS